MMLTHENHPADPGPSRWATMRLAVLGLTSLFTLGMVTGFTVIVLRRDGGFNTVTGIAEAALALIAAGSAAFLVRAWRHERRFDGPVAPRVKRSRRILVLCALAGMPLGFLQAAHGDGNVLSGPLPPFVAVVMMASVLLLIPVTWAWYRTCDELELAANNAGLAAGAHVFVLGAPLWWFAWRGGFAPQPDGVTIYMAVMLVWSMVWLWRRSG